MRYILLVFLLFVSCAVQTLPDDNTNNQNPTETHLPPAADGGVGDICSTYAGIKMPTYCPITDFKDHPDPATINNKLNLVSPTNKKLP